MGQCLEGGNQGREETGIGCEPTRSIVTFVSCRGAEIMGLYLLPYIRLANWEPIALR